VGQKKIKTIDLSKKEKEAENKKAKIAEAKKAAKPEEKVEKSAESKHSDKSSSGRKTKKTKKEKSSSKRTKKVRSRRYRILRTKIDRKKLYSLEKAIELLLKVSNARVDETIEIHIITHENKLTGSVSLPHGTGKSQKIVIASDRLIEEIKAGKIDFDVLIAEPKMMAKIAGIAKILGPKGLMPSPKTNTISDKPKELKKKLEQGETRFKTEAKHPLLHIVIGKVSFDEKKILENIEALIKAIGPGKIKKAVLTSTHSPGIKLKLKKTDQADINK